MHPDTHLRLHHLRAAELRLSATEFRLKSAAPGADLRTRLGWALVELGLRVLPHRAGHTYVAPGPA
ncbi:hypothetical protein [Streptomyces sp. NBC_00893]|uniref:hypothetical protein n=1 Tax=Streptomyces sp. NBC_00893 TaxID=2975862 RepID=UPI00225A3865|nr:hypothetical protein [Streptomyces sp. NBC_00893]MCX4847720.1 hypothetical protein [Streptomyces sp. NBC_00893]